MTILYAYLIGLLLFDFRMPLATAFSSAPIWTPIVSSNGETSPNTLISKKTNPKMQFGHHDMLQTTRIHSIKDDNSDDDKSNDNKSMFRGWSKRLFRQRDNNDENENRLGNNDNKNIGSLSSSSSSTTTTTLVAGVFETVDELRKRVSSMRATEELEEMVRMMESDSISSSVKEKGRPLPAMSPVEEERRLTEIRELIRTNRQKEERLQQASSQLSKERASTKDLQKREALVIAKQRVDEKLARVRNQGLLFERQRKLVLVASGKASKESLISSPSTSSSTTGPANLLSFFPMQNDKTMELEEAIEESTTSLVAGVFETVDELRKRVDAARTTESLREMVRSGTLMPPQEETRRLGELKERLAVTQKKKDRLQLALKELTKELASTKENSKREALSVAARRVEEKIARIKEQHDAYKEQRKLVLMASGKSTQESSNVLGSIAQFFRKSDDSETEKDFPRNEARSLKNVKSVPQTLFSRSQSESSTDGSSEKASQSSGGFPNPFAGAQRFVSNMFESESQLEQWVVAFPKSRIDPGEVKPIRVAGLDLLVVATRDGKKIYCIANSCSHLGTPLETGAMERRKKSDRQQSRTTTTLSTTTTATSSLTTTVSTMTTAADDGCEDCIVCPLHKTAFALETGEVNGEWCPYPPLLGTMMGAVKAKSSVAVFDIRTRGKNIEVKINSRLSEPEDDR